MKNNCGCQQQKKKKNIDHQPCVYYTFLMRRMDEREKDI